MAQAGMVECAVCRRLEAPYAMRLEAAFGNVSGRLEHGMVLTCDACRRQNKLRSEVSQSQTADRLLLILFGSMSVVLAVASVIALIQSR
ncbi:hypothetical protein ACFQX4_26840 [Roseomonas sp. GCM10028921]